MEQEQEKQELTHQRIERQRQNGDYDFNSNDSHIDITSAIPA